MTMTTISTRFWAAAAIASAVTLVGLIPSTVLAGTFATDQHEFIHRILGERNNGSRSVGSIVGGFGIGKDVSGIVRGSGVLVGDRYVVTAAHLVDDMGFSGDFRFNGQTYGIRRSVVADRFYRKETTGDNPSLNPLERLFGGGTDLALIELDRVVAGHATLKATLNRSRREAGLTATIVGFGTPGNGVTGIRTAPITDEDGAINNGDGAVWGFQPIRRAGKNVVEPTGVFALRPVQRELVTDFDPDPSQLQALAEAGLNPPSLDPFSGVFDVDEDDIPVSQEFMPAVGDSGGGLFVNGKLAGITSWTTRANSEFFAEAHYTRISVAWWRWIQNNIAAYDRLRANPGLVPWVSQNNPTLPGAGFKGVLRIRRGEPFEDNADTGRPENAGTRNVINIFGPNLFVGFQGNLLDVDQNLGPNVFIRNDPFGSDPAPLSQIITVPEPASLALLGLGGLAVLGRTRR